MACVFCGDPNGQITREHIFAAWLDRLYPDAAKIKGHQIITARNGTRTEYELFPFEQTVRVVCAACNNGWMSALESAVAPILGPMVLHGRAKRMSIDEQRTVARWAIKTAFIAEHLHPRDLTVPLSEYRRLFEERGPLPKYRVWIARRARIVDATGMPLLFSSKEQTIDRVSYEDNALLPEIAEAVAQGSRVYRLTFMLGHLVFAIFGHTFPNDFRVQFTADMAKIMVRIWPTQERVTWPPALTIEDMGGFEAFHGVFDMPAPPIG